MSEGKIAAQVGHVCMHLGRVWVHESLLIDKIVVLGLRENKFNEMFDKQVSNERFWIQKDLGLTEVDAGTITAFGYIE